MKERDIFIPGADNDAHLRVNTTDQLIVGHNVGRLTLLKHHPQTHDEASVDLGSYQGKIDEVTTFLRADHHSLYLRYEGNENPEVFDLLTINYQAHQLPEIANPADLAGNMALFSQIYAEEGIKGAFYPHPGVWVTHVSDEVHLKTSPREDESYLKHRTADWSEAEKQQFGEVTEDFMRDLPYMRTIDPRVRETPKSLNAFLNQIRREVWLSLPKGFRGLPQGEKREFVGAFFLTAPFVFLSRYYRALSEREEYQVNFSLMGGDDITFWVGDHENDEIGYEKQGKAGDIFKYEGSSYRLEWIREEEPRGIQILVDKLIPSRQLYRAVMPNVLPVAELYGRLEEAIKNGNNEEQIAIFEAVRPHAQSYYSYPQPEITDEES